MVKLKIKYKEYWYKDWKSRKNVSAKSYYRVIKSEKE